MSCIMFSHTSLRETTAVDYPLKMAEQLRPQLQALRKQRGLTQAQLGKMLGVTQARVVEIEANPGAVSLQQVMQVLNLLGCTLVIRTTETGYVNTNQDPGTVLTANETIKKGSW
jgi:HTH-type transcriptional regulator / antitoxin HipB